jgi:hypothetical protein
MARRSADQPSSSRHQRARATGSACGYTRLPAANRTVSTVRDTADVISDQDRYWAVISQLDSLTDSEVRQFAADIARSTPRALELP